MLNFFAVPYKERDYQRYMVFVLTIIWSLVIAVMVSSGFLFFPDLWQRWLSFLGISIFLAGINLTLNRMGHTRTAAWSLSIMLWLFITVPCYTAGGIIAPGILSQMSVILTAGFLLGWRGGLAIGLLTMGTDFWLAYMEISGQLPEPEVVHTPITRWIGAIIPFSTILALQYYSTSHLHSDLLALTREVSKREEAEKEKNETVYRLGERVKELKTLFEVNRILRDDDFPSNEFFSKIIEEICKGLQFPELVVARLTIGEKTFVNKNFNSFHYPLYAEMKTGKGTKVGIEIAYDGAIPGSNEGLFLKEEQSLLNVLADMLSSELDRRERKAELKDFRHALDIAALVSVSGADARFTFVNENFCKISQYSADELVGEHHDILWSGQHAEQYFAELRIAMQNGKPIRREFCNRAKDGSLYWVDSTIVPFLDGEGKIVQYLSINYDITERKLASEKLRESEELYRSIITVSNTGAWEYYLDTDRNWFSPQYLNMLGIERAEGLWQEPLDNIWVERLHPDEKEQALLEFKTFLESQSTEIWENFFRLRHENGDWISIWSRAKRLQNEDGSLTQTILGTHIDISERIKAEEKVRDSERLLRKITSQVPGNTYMFEINEDGTYKILFMSQGTDRFNHSFEFDKVSNNADVLREELHKDDNEKFDAAMREAYRSHSPISLQYRMILNGEVRWRWMQATPEENKDGKILWYGVTSDITALVEHIASIEQMIFDIGHVIRRPLSTLLSLTKLIQSAELGEDEIREISKHLQVTAEEMDKFIRELNDAYHLKRKNNKLNIDVSPLINNRSSLFD